jgi:hypothetical protein
MPHLCVRAGAVYCVHATFASMAVAHALAQPSREDETGGTALSASDCSRILTYRSAHVTSVGAGMGACELKLEKSAMTVVSQTMTKGNRFKQSDGQQLSCRM